MKIESTVFKPTDERIKILTRHKPSSDGSLMLDWTGSGIMFNAYCKGDITVNLSQTGVDRFYQVVVDGVQKEIHIKNADKPTRVVIAEKLKKGKHKIEFYKEMQCLFPITVYDIELTGRLLERPKDNDTLIEFIGDSITCGSCCLGLNSDDWSWHRDDGTKSYAVMTAKALGFDYSIVARGGGTLIPSTKETIAGNTSLPEVYNKIYHLPVREDGTYDDTDNLWDFENNRKADIVVINLGTNDTGVSEKQGIKDKQQLLELFERSLNNFVDDLIAKNGADLKIVFAFGMMQSQESPFADVYKNAVKGLVEKEINAYYCPMPEDTDGTAGHPQVKGHIAAAKVLTDFIKKEVL